MTNLNRPVLGNGRRTFAFVLITGGTVLSLGATDLVLPAIPSLPAALGGSIAQAQYVLAAFAAGLAAGLLVFGDLAARKDPRRVLIGGLLLFAGGSFTAGMSSSMEWLIVLRVLQGLGAAAAAVLAPAMIRTIFDEEQAVRAFGLQGSIESLVPALAPALGTWLLSLWAWNSSFFLLGVLGLLAAAATLLVPRAAFGAARRRPGHGYWALLRNTRFLRLALSQAFTLAGLLVLVFGAPVVMVRVLGGTLHDFVAMQVLGVAFFIAAANLAGVLAGRCGAERLIVWGSLLSAAGIAAILAYALAGGKDPVLVASLFVPVNLGLGLRAPPGSYQAIAAAEGDDARAAALMILAVLLVTAAGTVGVAPWIEGGLVPLALAALAISLASVVVLLHPRFYPPSL